MADYKLKLDIDASLLQKKIADALKATGLSGLSGVGKAFSPGKGPYESFIKQANKDTEQMKRHTLKMKHQMKLDLEARIQQRQMAIKQAAYTNAMVRKSGEKTAQSFQMIGQLLGGRYGGAGGAIIGQLAAQKGFWKPQEKSTPGFAGAAKAILGEEKAEGLIQMDKQKQSTQLNRFPRLVKIAGIAAGAAGMAGLGKMIIDSSPMMQTMLKLMNLGIMFTLRPIGDMIGMVFRPLIISFVKWSVDWYKGWAEHMPTWESWGKKLNDFIEDPATALSDLTKAIADAVAKALDVDPLGPEAREQIDKFFAAYDTFFKEGGTLQIQWEAFVEWALSGINYMMSGDFVRDIKANWDRIVTGFANMFGVFGVSLDYILNGGLEESVTAFVDGFVELFENIWKSISDGFTKFWVWLKDIPILGDLFKAAEKALLGPDKMPIGGDKDSPYIAPRMEYDDLHGTNTAQELMSQVNTIFEGVETSLEETGKYFEQIKEGAWTALIDALNSFVSIGKIENAFVYAENTSAHLPKHAIEDCGYFEYIVNTLEASANLIANALESIAKTTRRTSDGGTEPTKEAKVAMGINYNQLKSGFSGGGSGSRQRYKITLGDGRSFTQALDPTSLAHLNRMRGYGELLKGSPILSIQKMAAGGLITEPIFGIGQNTGKGYLMGEAGPERITPGTGKAKGETTKPVFNITINAHYVGDIERQLKPAILKMLKESTSRAGIV
jgi:hypothetical protein